MKATRPWMVMVTTVSFVFYLVFCVKAVADNGTTHTYFHGPGTGELLSNRGDSFWWFEFFVIVAFLLASILLLFPSYGKLNLSNFSIWFYGMAVCWVFILCWHGVMIGEVAIANKCTSPLNRANDLQWCSACFNTSTVSGDPNGLTGDFFCRYTPLPEDVLTTGQLSVSNDFIWKWIAGSIVTLGCWIVFVMSLVYWAEEHGRDAPGFLSGIVQAIQVRIGSNVPRHKSARARQ